MVPVTHGDTVTEVEEHGIKRVTLSPGPREWCLSPTSLIHSTASVGRYVGGPGHGRTRPQVERVLPSDDDTHGTPGG